MIFGVQYYRPPFPVKKYWDSDFPAIKAAGFNTIQFWVHWGWVEPEPGKFVFDDYDELMSLAQANDLKVVLSLSAELQPYWIHRVVPDSHMIDHMGHKVISTNRGEAHQGFTPGGCTDNPEVSRRMRIFLQTVAERYGTHPNLIAWDCWNELRWCIQSDGLVCHCEYTKQAFRQWLNREYGGLDGLNRAWQRRYSSWEDVEPGKLPGRPYTEMMEFETFQQWKLARHLKFRVDAIRSIDDRHVISAHEGGPPSLYGWGDLGEYGSGGNMLHALHSGRLFDMADQVDVFGTSHYPGFQTATLAEFGSGVELTRSANGGGRFWISELQGHHKDTALLSSWYWSSLARGAKAVLGWQWRSEVFGREAGSFGIVGRNDDTEERLSVFREIGDVICRHTKLLNDYLPDQAEIGLFHDANTYNLEWAASGGTTETSFSLKGWSKALERTHIPYSFVDSDHMDSLSRIRLLIMGKPTIVPEQAASRILEYVQEGGTLVIEGGADAFTTLGFYQYAGEERPFALGLGIDYAPPVSLYENSPFYQLTEPGKAISEGKFREEIGIKWKGKEYIVYGEGSMTPLSLDDSWEVLAVDHCGNTLAASRQVGKGTVLALGGFLGKGYHRANHVDLERFLYDLSVDANVNIPIHVQGDDVYWHTGMTGDKRLLFLVNAGQSAMITVGISKELIPQGLVQGELIKGVDCMLRDCGDNWELESEIERCGTRLFVIT